MLVYNITTYHRAIASIHNPSIVCLYHYSTYIPLLQSPQSVCISHILMP